MVKRSVNGVNDGLPMSELIATGTGVRLRAVRWGDPATHSAKPIVLVHGLASNAMLWEGAALALVQLGHPVIAIDLRGHGLSDKPEDGYDMSSVTEDLAGLLTAIAPRGYSMPVVCGQSWGGNVVIELAHKYSHLVSGVVPVDGGFLELQNNFADWDSCADALRPPNLIGTPAKQMRAYMQSRWYQVKKYFLKYVLVKKKIELF